jgi:hypothetical protein
MLCAAYGVVHSEKLPFGRKFPALCGAAGNLLEAARVIFDRVQRALRVGRFRFAP